MPEREPDSKRNDATNPPLNEIEIELSLICLKYFRGDWDMYLDYLQGPRVTDSQRRREIPLVEQLRDRDRRTDYLTFFVEDEIVACLQKMSFPELIRIWEDCVVLNPEADPFPEDARASDETEGHGESAQDVPPTLH